MAFLFCTSWLASGRLPRVSAHGDLLRLSLCPLRSWPISSHGRSAADRGASRQSISCSVGSGLPIRSRSRSSISCCWRFLPLLTISTFAHDWQDKPPCGVPPVWQLVTGYLMPACVYWIARQSRLTQRNVAFVHGALACFGIYLAITGLAEVSRQWWLVFPSYIADPSVGLHFGRARGPMVQAVSYGFFLGVTLLAGYVWRSRWSRLGQLIWLRHRRRGNRGDRGHLHP